MEVSRPRAPITLLIVIAVLLVLGLLAGPFINSRMTEEQLADNVIIYAVPFVLIFVAIILAFIAFIVVVASMLDDNISSGIHRIIESILITGIVLSVVGMFQSRLFEGYKYGFILLLISTLCFILWSRVTPRREVVQEEAGSRPLGETAQDSLESSSGGK